MEMKSERESIKRQLDDELDELRFTRHEKVIARTHPRTWQARIHSLWNKDIELPLLPVGLAVVFLFSIIGVERLQMTNSEMPVSHERRQLIKLGGNTYWTDEYERAVASIENTRES